MHSILPALRTILATCCASASLPLLHAESFTLQEATIDQIQKAMADGALSSVELTSLYLNRIAIYDRNGQKLNAVPLIDPTALAQAQAADGLRAAGTVLGPLHGVPALMKDSFKVNGLSTSNGLAAWGGLIAKDDAFVVTKLREAGTVILGKTNMTILASSGDEFSDIYGRTKNPYNPFGPGGSSSGSATAIAANLASFSFGGDTYGSIRNPTGRTNLAGLKPTFGLISGRGTFSLLPAFDVIGPITRSIGDLSHVLNVAVADDAQNPNKDDLPPFAQMRPANYRTNLTAGVAGKKFAIPNYLVGRAGNADFSREIGPVTLAAFDAVVEQLRAAGATVIYADVPSDQNMFIPLPARVDPTLTFPEPWGAFYAYFQSRDYEKDQAYYLSTMIKSIDPAADVASLFAAIPRTDFEGYYSGFYDTDRLLQLLADDDLLTLSDAPARAHKAAANAIVNQFLDGWMNQNGIDALIFPQIDVWEAGADVQGDYYMNQLGSPGIFIPTGFVDLTTVDYGDENSGKGPFGITFIGRKFDEAKLLQYAAALETLTKARVAPESAPPLPGETIEYSTALPPPSRPELNAPALRVAAGAKVAGKGKKATLVLTGGAVDASGLDSLTVYVNGKKIAAKRAANWKASVKLSALRSFVKGSAKTVQVTVVAKDVYGNTSVTTKTVKLPKTA